MDDEKRKVDGGRVLPGALRKHAQRPYPSAGGKGRRIFKSGTARRRNCTLDPELDELLTGEALRTDCTASAIVNRALRDRYFLPNGKPRTTLSPPVTVTPDAVWGAGPSPNNEDESEGLHDTSDSLS